MEIDENKELTDRKRAMIFLCLIVSGIASSTLATAMTTALPNLVDYFGISTTIGQWVTSGYSLAMGMIMPLTAFLITRFPTKKLYLIGIGSFIAGLILSIFAGHFGVMMAGRILQACGNGVLMSAAQVIILTVYPEGKKGTMMGTYGLATTAAPIIAPTIAGLMIDAFGWKSIFYLVLVIMVISFIISSIVFEDVLELQNKKFDFLSFVESIIAFGGITLGIGNISAFGLISVEAGIPLLLGAVVCVFFVVRQCKLEKPFLDITILNNRNYAVSVISSMVLYLVMMGSSVMMPLYVQTVMGYSAVVSGLVTLPGSFATAVISPFAGRLYDKMGIKNIFIIGSAGLLLSNLGMFFLTVDTPLWVACDPQYFHRQLNDATANLGNQRCRSAESRGCFFPFDLPTHHCRSHRIGGIRRNHDRSKHKFCSDLWEQRLNSWHEYFISLDGCWSIIAVDDLHSGSEGKNRKSQNFQKLNDAISGPLKGKNIHRSFHALHSSGPFSRLEPKSQSI